MEIIKYDSCYQKELLRFIIAVFDENNIELKLTQKHSDILNPLSVYFSFYIVVDNDDIVGCVGVRDLDSDKRIAELKRLYLSKAYHKRGIGGRLVKSAIKSAANKEYKYMRLDTKEQFSNAIALFEKYGFYQIKRYNDSDATLFYEVKL